MVDSEFSGVWIKNFGAKAEHLIKFTSPLHYRHAKSFKGENACTEATATGDSARISCLARGAIHMGILVLSIR